MCSILFVDDERIATDIGTKMLSRLGHDVVGVDESSEALKLFHEKPDSFDLVITDYMMPVMKGNELASRLRLVRNDIPLVLCTGYSGFSEWDIQEWGFDAHVNKPYNSKELGDIVRQVMQSRQLDCEK